MVNILIVDDDEDLLQMVCLMIQVSDMSATCANTGSGILQTLASSHVDLIVMDVYLDSYDGRELTRQIKTDDRFSHIPVLLYSAGNIAPESIRESLADAFLQKPFDMPVLIGKIRDMVVS